MAHDLTEDDEFAESMSVPDGGDARTAGSIEPSFQTLADRSRWLKNRAGVYVRYAIAAPSPGIASGSKLPLVALTDAALTSGDFTLASNEVTVPAAGVYLVALMLRMACSAATEPLEVRVSISAGTAGAYKSNEIDAAGLRIANGQQVWASASGHIKITDPTTEKIKLLARNSNVIVDDTLEDSRRSFSILRVA